MFSIIEGMDFLCQERSIACPSATYIDWAKVFQKLAGIERQISLIFVCSDDKIKPDKHFLLYPQKIEDLISRIQRTLKDTVNHVEEYEDFGEPMLASHVLIIYLAIG